MTGLLQNGPRFESDSKSDQRVYTAGLKGALGEYDWGVSYVFGTTQLEPRESDGQPADVLSCAGLGICFNNCRDGDPIWIQSFADVPKVSQHVWETALEFGVYSDHCLNRLRRNSWSYA